jgi:glucose-6-phosphate-specific signal transduction histidine kinase
MGPIPLVVPPGHLRGSSQEVVMATVWLLGEDPYPWYRSHRRAAVLTASLLFLAVTGIHLLVNGTGQAVDILYALPVALLAMSFGLRGGLIGATIGFALFAVVEVFHGVGDIDATGWITRGAGLFLLGALLGHATDQIEIGQHRTMAEHE